MLLLPICGKTFERLLFNEIFNFFIKNKLISSVQYGFKSGYSYFNQLLSITHEIYEYFDVDFEIKSVFLDESKTFDEVAGLNHLQTNSKWNIGEYTKPFAGSFLKERKVSTWGNINTGVHQGSILGPLLFFIYISDPKEGLTTNAKLLANDTSLFSVVHDTQTSANDLKKDLEIINN